MAIECCLGYQACAFISGALKAGLVLNSENLMIMYMLGRGPVVSGDREAEEM